MTYEEIVAKAKEEFGSADVSNYEGHLALQINVTGEGEGTFYTEINDGKLYIEPYDYKGSDAVLTADGNDIISIFSGALNPADALENGKLGISGDVSKALSIKPVIDNNKKPAKKTTAVKKTPAKTSEKAASKTTKTVSKTVKKDEAESATIVGLSEAKKSVAPKSTAKKSASKNAKGSTKSAKNTTSKTTAKKG